MHDSMRESAPQPIKSRSLCFQKHVPSPKMTNIIFDSAARFQITGIFNDLAVFIKMAGFSFLFFFFQINLKSGHKQNGCMGRVSLTTFSDCIVLHKQDFCSDLDDGSIDFFYSLYDPVLVHGWQKRYLDKSGDGFHYFKTYNAAEVIHLGKRVSIHGFINKYD